MGRNDVVVLFSAQLTVSQQYAQMDNNAYILACSRKHVAGRKREMIIPLYSALMRPYLEKRSQLWVPRYKKVIKALEYVQKGQCI